MLRYLLEKEFKQLFRNTFLPRLFLAMPLAMLLLFPFAANQEVKHLNFVAVCHDEGMLARRLIEKVGATERFSLVATASDFDEAMVYVESGNADLILELSPDFERRLSTEEGSDVFVAINGVSGVKGGLAQGYLSTIVSDFSHELIDEGTLPNRAGGAALRTSSLGLAPRFLFNPTLDYKNFMIPAVIAMLLVLTVGFLPVFNIVGEKERGTIEQINVTPIRPFTFILSKLIPYWTVGLSLLGYAMVAAWLIHGLSPAGNVVTIFLFAALFVLVISSLALVVSNYSDTTQAAAFLMFFFLVIFILMSGLLTPIASMPTWAQWLTVFNPFRYFMEAMRSLYLKGSSFADLLPQAAALLAMAGVSGTWATLSYRKNA